MQGQRGKMVSLPETFEIDRASSSSWASLDQQLFRNDVRGTPETHFSGFVLPPNESRLPCMNFASHEQRYVGDWSLGEASSSSAPYRSSNSDWKPESGWASMAGRDGPRIEDQRLGPSNTVLSLDNASTNAMFVHGSGSSSIPPNISSNGEYVGPIRENPFPAQYTNNLYKSSGLNNNLRYPMPPANQEDFLFPLGSGGYVREESEAVRLGGSLEGRRVPCKRKSFEGHVGQSSHIENPNFPQPMESSPWVATPPCFNINGGPATHTIPEKVGPRLGLDLAGGAVGRCLLDTESARIAHRNFRLRVNSLGQIDPRPTSLSSSAVAASGSPSVTSAVQSSSRLVLPNRSLELPPPVASTGPVPQGLHPLLQVPGVMAPGGHSVRWSRGPIQRNNGSSSHPILPDDASSSGNSRNMSQHPGLVPSLSSSTRGFVSASSSGFPGTADSAALGSSSSAAPPLPQHSSAPQPNHHHHPRHLRRLSDYVSSQLLSSIGSDFGGGQTSNAPDSSGRPVLPDVLLPSRPGSSGHRASSSRPAVWMERQGDSVVGIPYPMRTLAAGSEGRRRLPSELRNMLELVRRGEGRFRDVMILDPSMFFADMHDHHRDMRLDVDNMSYEELLALEERIGNVNTGLNEETIFARMKQRKHSNMANARMDAEPCCICQEEYNDGEDIGSLDCGHDFHRDCIKQWFTHKNLCPICKTTGLTT